MRSTVQAAARLRAIHPGPVFLADAGRGLEIVRAVVGTARQALVYLLVDLVAPFTLPASLAVTLAGDTGTVSAAVRVGTIRWKLQSTRD